MLEVMLARGGPAAAGERLLHLLDDPGIRTRLLGIAMHRRVGKELTPGEALMEQMVRRHMLGEEPDAALAAAIELQKCPRPG
jgi:hypothetical protein